ncbi:MAG TPA: hypothetical protein VMX35_16355 [Acidobacteriota bacterium]|nr:hypothetical protein [Acidobacteriota bacterium]
MSGDGQPSLRAAFFWLALFSIAFAWIESAVVHYLHYHFYPEGFAFPLVQWPAGVLVVELGREFSTIVVLAAVAFFAGRSWWRRFAWFMFAFGVWDIFYYIWLVLFEGWPQSLLTPDLLFLLPVPWAGPVIAPVLVSVFLVLSAIILVWIEERTGRVALRKGYIITVLGAWALILLSFMLDSVRIITSGDIGPYHGEIFVPGLALWAAVLARIALARKDFSDIQKASE